MRRNTIHAIALAVWATCAFGQSPAFDAVSVKPNHSESGSSSSNDHNGVLTATNVSLKNLIMRAYGLLDYQIAGPDWLSSDRFDVAAKPPQGAKDAEFPLMMRTMLADRFKLTAHKGTKVFPVYGLAVAKGGLKIQPVEDTGGNSMSSQRDSFKCERCSMAGVAGFLARRMDRPVLDMTGLPGVYTFTLNWTPDDAAPEKTATDAYPPLLTALQEQLGLKLEPKKAPIEILIVDSVEKIPTEN